MPKLKTRKSLIKRFKITKTGKILRRQASRRHLKAGKSKKRLRNLKRIIELKGYYAKKIRKAAGIKKDTYKGIHDKKVRNYLINHEIWQE